MEQRGKIALGASLVGVYALLTGVSTSEYGPTADHGVRAGEGLADVVSKYGMPYDSMKVGNQTVYRWGHRKVRKIFGFKSWDNHELDITADAQGRISSAVFKDAGQEGSFGVMNLLGSEKP